MFWSFPRKIYGLPRHMTRPPTGTFPTSSITNIGPNAWQPSTQPHPASFICNIISMKGEASSMRLLRQFLHRFSIAEYFNLIQNNRNYRLYLLSHVCQHGGDWVVHISALLSVQRIVPGSSTALSILVMCRTIPEVIISPLGGILADKFDRKNLMIKLDMLAAICVLSYIYAVREESIYLFYGATIIRSSITATYHSITNSIVPQLVSDPEDLKRAATINGFVWSGMLAVGGVIAGWASARIGVEVCFFYRQCDVFDECLRYIECEWQLQSRTEYVQGQRSRCACAGVKNVVADIDSDEYRYLYISLAMRFWSPRLIKGFRLFDLGLVRRFKCFICTG